ncbi:MAG: hypothetical protein FGM14_12625 [Flavobacteriales bacterium]|nr:hypothetical protein [Flavobacteriales bacterium]
MITPKIKSLIQYSTHEKLFEAVIFSANEEQNKPIIGGYELLKEVWFYLNSDSATFNGKEVEKYKRPLFINPVINGKPEFNDFLDAEIKYCSTQNKINLTEQDFISDLCNWIEKKSKNESLTTSRKRKYNEFFNFINERKNEFESNEKDEVKATPKEPEIEHPFSSQKNFELFKYLDEWFKPTAKKAKYTYIYNHFKDNNFEPILSQNSYFEFVEKFKNISIANRLQGAPSNKIDAEINRLVSEFKK